MPYRTYTREQDWLLPPSLGELVPSDHPVRFVAEFVDLLDLAEVGIQAEAAQEGAPSYHPKALLATWLYGFMSHVRSSRKLERACCENVVFMWLTGMQQPDHVTLWRFYKLNRKSMRPLLKQTISLAGAVGLLDFALQAVDGCRVSAASLDSWRGRAAVEKLLAEVAAEITAMEQANQGEEMSADHRPAGRQAFLGKQEQRERLQRALNALIAAEKAPPVTGSDGEDRESGGERSAADEAQTDAGSTPGGDSVEDASLNAAGESQVEVQTAPSAKDGVGEKKAPEPRVSTTDPEAVWIKGRHGCRVGYNGQAVVDSKAQIIVAADVVACGADHNQLAPMLDEALAMTDRPAQVIVADTGYFSMIGIAHAQAQQIEAYVPDRRATRKDAPAKNPYHKEHFVYDPLSDTLRCPLGHGLTYLRSEQRQGRATRVFQCRTCLGCPAQVSGACTKSQGRRIIQYGHEAELQAHAAKMQTEAARAIMRQRSATVEPVFAVFREHLGLLRFLLRGLENVKAEWRLLSIAHNLRKLWKLWWRPKMLRAAAGS